MSLLAPAFLAGLLAIVVPWWLHRLNRDNPPLRDFGSSMFLEAGETSSSKQKQLRYKALFALRCLLLALLALLFAEPALRLTQLIGATDYRQIMVVDTSLSQRLGNRWTQTVDLVNKELDNISSGDEVFLINASHQFQQAQGDNTVDAAREQLQALQPGLTRLDYGQIAPALAELIQQSSLPVKVHLFTDTQASAMPARLSDLNLDGVVQFDVHSTKSDNDTNLSVTAQLDHGADGASDFTVIVSNTGDASSTTEADIELLAAGALLDKARVSVDGGSNSVHRFRQVDTRNAGGVVEVRVTGADDQLTDDNTWLIALPDDTRTEVALLQSNAIANRYAQAAIESDPRYSTKQIEGENLSASLAGGLLIVADATALSDRATNKLRQYLSDGGNAFIAVGADPHALQMRNMLQVRSASTQVSSQRASEENQRGTLQPQGIGKIDDTHPLTSATRDNWRSVSVLRHLPLNVDAEDKTIIELADGSPLLIERRIGEGKVLVFASALSTTWNDLAVNPLFVALMVGVIEHLSGFESDNSGRSVGDTLTAAPGAQVLNPDGEPIRELSTITRRGRVDLSARGIYTLRSTTGTQTFAVNVDSRESDISAIDSTALSRWVSAGNGQGIKDADAEDSASDSTDAAAVDTTQAEQAVNQTHSNRQQRSLWPWLLALLMILALAESLYSHRHLHIKREA